MIEEKYQIGIVILLTLLPILLLPFLEFSGKATYVIQDAEDWTLTTSIRGYYAYEGTNLYANITGATSGSVNCKSGYGKLSNNSLYFTNMDVLGINQWKFTYNITDAGRYYYNITCWNISNPSDYLNTTYTFIILNNTILNVTYPSTILTGLNNSFNASYKTHYGTSIYNATCTIDFSSPIAMTQNGDSYNHIKTFSSNDSYTFTVNCSKEGYSWRSQGTAIDVLPFFELAQEFPGYYESSLALADYDNDDDWDLFVMGNTGSGYEFKYYTNNGDNFVNATSFIDDYTFGSISSLDYDNDGDLDVFVTGDAGTPTAKLYVKNLDNYSDSGMSFTGVKEGSTAVADIDDDGKIDIFYTGDDNNDRITRFYHNVNNNFIINNSLDIITPREFSSDTFCYINDEMNLIILGDIEGSIPSSEIYNVSTGIPSKIKDLVDVELGSVNCFDFDNDNDLDVFITGLVGSDFEGPILNNSLYLYENEFIESNKDYPSLYFGFTSYGDVDNDGIMDLFMSGKDDSDLKFTSLYINNSELDYPFIDLQKSSGALFDFDNDGDLDIIISGEGDSNNLLIYKSNYNLIHPNNAPSAPEVDVDYSDGRLIINWTKGDDLEQGEDGLYYNLRVGSTPEANDVVSGKYGGSSNPTSGYIGNMQQRRNISLNVPKGTYYVSVQTIDAGLKAGNWSTEEIYDSCVPPDGDWEISNTDCTISNKIVNGSITIDNATITVIGTLTISQDSDNQHNITITDGTLIVNNAQVQSNKLIDINGKIESTNGYFTNCTLLLNNSRITKSIGTSVILADNNIMSNSSMYYISVAGSNNTLINTTQDILSGTGSFNVYYYLEFINPQSLSGINVSIYRDSYLIASGIANIRKSFLLESFNYTQGTRYDIGNYTVNITKELMYKNSTFVELDDNKEVRLTLLSGYPDTTGFNVTPDFSTLTRGELANVTPTISINGVGIIKFNEPIDVRGVNFADSITIDDNLISIDIPSWENKSADITFKGLNFNYTPSVFRDGEICDECSIIGWNSTNVVVRIIGFSSYFLASNSQLIVTLSRDKIVPNQSFKILTNYYDTDDGSLIYDGSCTTNVTLGVMSENSTRFYAEKNYSQIGLNAFTVSCISPTHENLSSSSVIEVEKNKTKFEHYQDLIGMYDGANVIVNKPISPDYILISGHNQQNVISSYVYQNNLGILTLQPSSLGSISGGSIGFTNLDNDNQTDIVLTGNNNKIRYE